MLIQDQVNSLRFIMGTVLMVLQMPQKRDQVVFCPLGPKQTTAYKQILATSEVQNMIYRDDPCVCGSRRKCVSSFPR